MDILIATSSTTFAKGLQESFEKQGVNVVEIVTAVEDLLEILAQNPSVEGVLIKTDLAKKGEDPRLELFSDVLLNIRAQGQFQKLVFTVLTDYEEGHPLLAELFEMGIYNFFSRNSKEFTVKNLIDSFSNQMSFSLSVKYRNVNPEIPWRKSFEKPTTLKVDFANVPKEAASTNVEEETEVAEDGATEKGFKMPNINLQNINLPNFKLKREKTPPAEAPLGEQPEKEEDWKLEVKRDNELPKVIGTVVIAVTSVRPHLGSTNTAVSMAAYLHQRGYDVALVEANKSMDFDRMHSLIEGEDLQIGEMEYQFNGIPHFKYREGFDIGRIFQLYKYVVLDMGFLETSPYKEEFTRSHIKCVVASGDEWKLYWIEEFMLKHQVEDPIFLLPSSSNEVAEDLATRLKNKHYVYPLAHHTSPYIVPDRTLDIYETILDEYSMSVDFKEQKKDYQKFMYIGVGSAFIVAALFILIQLFKTI